MKPQVLRSPWIRLLLIVMMAIGLLLLPIGPLARIRNEGFGDAPGPADVSAYWQKVSYVLIPLGAGIAIVSGTLLAVVDRSTNT